MNRISDYYDNLVEKHGFSPMASDANSQEGLAARWNVLGSVCDLRDKTVLDIGCGIGVGGGLLQGRVKKYTGIDISKKAIELGNINTPLNLIHADAFEWTEKADVVLSQGPFYLADEAYAERLIDKMWNLADVAVAFTGISVWCDVKDDYYRLDPLHWTYYLRKYTDKIVMRHDYWRGDVYFAMYR